LNVRATGRQTQQLLGYKPTKANLPAEINLAEDFTSQDDAARPLATQATARG
jgi:hypothetical protein